MGMGSAIPNNTRLTNINLTPIVTSTRQFINLFVTVVFYSFLKAIIMKVGSRFILTNSFNVANDTQIIPHIHNLVIVGSS